MFTRIGWQVARCDSIWQVMLCSSVKGFHQALLFTLKLHVVRHAGEVVYAGANVGQ